MLSAVLDTNIVVSAHVLSIGRQALLLDLALRRRFLCVASEAILKEYEIVLRRPRFHFSDEAVTASLTRIRQTIRLVTPARAVRASVDPADNKFIECALEGAAQYWVTGNLKHYPPQFETVRVVSPNEFAKILFAALQDV